MSRAIIAAALLISAVSAQPAFDVASVRATQARRGEGDWRDDIQASPGSLIMRNVTLKAAIRWAYHVMSYQVTGPDWLEIDHYNISGKAGGPVDEDQLRLMLQALLAERFKLEVPSPNERDASLFADGWRRAAPRSTNRKWKASR